MTPNRLTGILKLTSVSAAILLGTLILNPEKASGQSLPGLYRVDLTWNGSPSPEVTSYRIHYGTTRGTYTGNIAVGNVTTATIPGLENGITYYFAVSAVSSTGEESELSNEASYLPGLHTTGLSVTANGGAVLTVRGLIGQQYDIEATQDLETWILISRVTVGDGGTLEFSDPNAADFPKRFYRTRETP